MLCNGGEPPISQHEWFPRRVWKEYPIDNVVMVKKGIYLVHFVDKSNAEKVVNKVGLHFDDKPIVVVPWYSDLEFEKGEYKYGCSSLGYP